MYVLISSADPNVWHLECDGDVIFTGTETECVDRYVSLTVPIDLRDLYYEFKD